MDVTAFTFMTINISLSLKSMNNRNINRDLNIDQNNGDYHFGHNCAALVSCEVRKPDRYFSPMVITS